MINVEVGIMCSSAYASNENYEWTLSIRKRDNSEVGEIAKYHKKTVTSQYLRNYLSGWEDIAWRELRTPPMFPKELMGECGEYQLNIIIAENNRKTEEVIRQEFNEFMQL